MSNVKNQTEAKKLNRLSLNKETITDLEITRNEQDEVKGGAPTQTIAGQTQSIIGPTIVSARCSYICK
jgi:hypothetical protein